MSNAQAGQKGIVNKASGRYSGFRMFFAFCTGVT